MSKSPTIPAILAAGVLSAITYPVHPLLAIGVLVTLVLAIFLTVVRFKGRTWAQWRKLAKHRKTTTRTDSLLFSTKRQATTWDGSRLSMFLELVPSPFKIVSLTKTTAGVEGMPQLPLNAIARSLRQYDISVDHIGVTSHGYVSATNDPYDVVYAATSSLGQLSRSKTVIEVSIHLATALNAVDARRGNDDGPEVGAARVIYVATQRLMRSLIDEGWGVKSLSQKDITAIDTEFSNHFGDAFIYERKSDMGDSVLTRIYESRSPHVNVDDIPLAHTVTVTRTLTPKKHNLTDLDTTVAVTGENYDDIDSSSRDLVVSSGVQGDLLSQMLPLAPHIEVTRNNTLVHYDVEDVEDVGAAYGTGIALGERKGRSRDNIFLTLAGAYGSVLYAFVGTTHLKMMMLRMSAAGEKVSIDLPEVDGVWSSWVQAVGSDSIVYGDTDTSTVRFIDAQSRVDAVSSKITIAVCSSPPPRSARYTLVSGDESNLYTLSTPDERVSYYATADKRELPWLRNQSR